MSRSITVGELFTDAELKEACAIYSKGGNAQEVKTKIVEPVMDRINKTTGQENDALYMAYVLEHVYNQIKK